MQNEEAVSDAEYILGAHFSQCLVYVHHHVMVGQKCVQFDIDFACWAVSGPAATSDAEHRMMVVRCGLIRRHSHAGTVGRSIWGDAKPPFICVFQIFNIVKNSCHRAISQTAISLSAAPKANVRPQCRVASLSIMERSEGFKDSDEKLHPSRWMLGEV